MIKLLRPTLDLLPRLVRTMGQNNGIIEESFDTIREHLWKHAGGKIGFSKNTDTGVATVYLQHPEKRNAMSGRMMVELRDCVEDLEKWNEGKAVLIYGKGENFCSGADLDFARAIGNAQGAWRMSTWMQDTLKRLHNLPLFSVCLVEGPSLGGGAEISIFCDYILAADNVKYGFVHCRMGIITSWGGATRLSRKIGQHKALDLLLTSKLLSAQECVDIGLAECVVTSSQALADAERWLQPRIQHHFTVTRGIKDVMCKMAYLSFDEALQYEKNKFIPFWGSEINKEALSKKIKHVKP